MKKAIYSFLSFLFGLGTIGTIVQIEKLGIQKAIPQIIFGLVLTIWLYKLSIKEEKRQQTLPQSGNYITVTKTKPVSKIEEPINITDEQLEIERAKIKVNKLKRRFTFSDFAFMFLMLCIPIFGWAYIVYRVGRYLMKERYFMSKEFIQHKMQIDEFVKEYNDIARYVEKFQSISLQSNSSDKYKYAHLATGSNTSAYNIKRDRNTVNQSRYIHNASLQVVRNAELEPFKYLCKYFDFKPNEENLQYIQDLGEQVSRFLNAKRNLDSRYNRIIGSIRPPHFIMKHYQLEFLHLI